MTSPQNPGNVDQLLGEIHSLQDRVSKLSRLLDVAKLMSLQRDLDGLLTFIARQVTSAVEADRCSVFLLDAKNREIWSKVALGTDEEIRFPAGSGIAGQVINTGQIINIPDAYADERFNRTVDDHTGYRTRNLLCVPLRDINGMVIGALQVLNKKAGAFDVDDQEYLLAFGAQAAVAVESAQLYREREDVIRALVAAQGELKEKMRQLDLLYHVERELNQTDEFDAFMQGVIKRTVEALDAGSGSILMKEEGTDALRFTYPYGQSHQVLKDVILAPGEGIAGWVLRTARPCLDNQAPRNPAFSPRIQELLGVGTESMMAVPLIVTEGDGENRAGVIEVINKRHGFFSPDDLKVLQLLAAQMASAIARRRLLAEKEKSQRLATIGTMASSIIHDFKNPMAIIRGYGELIQKMTLSPPDRDRFCRIIVAEVDRCVNMTKEILYFVRGEKNFKFEPIQMRAFFDEIALVLDNELKANKVNLAMDIQYDGELQLDVDKIKRVIFNLSNNAISVMPDGGTFSISCKRQDGLVELRISDTGPGIPVEIRKKLFSAFATFGKKEGTGLGLCISKDICEGHGGSICVEDAPVHGACFIIRIPVSRPGATPSS